MKRADREATIEMLRADADAELHSDDPSGNCTADSLYWAAWDLVAVLLPDDEAVGVISLEAAALLEDGWNPGDPVERIG